jgi:hypothetical protein
MAIIEDFLLWLVAVAKNWYGYVGGSATAGMVGLGPVFGWWESPGPRTYTVLIVIGVVVSMFQAWHKEHSQVRNLTDLSLRSLGGDIHQWVIHKMPGDGKSFEVLFQMELINEGIQPLMLTEGRLLTTDYSAIQAIFNPHPLEAWVAWDSVAPPRAIPDIYALFNSTPLQPYIPKEGWIGFVIDGISQDRLFSMSYTVVLKDEKGREYPCEYDKIDSTSSTIRKLKPDEADPTPSA